MLSVRILVLLHATSCGLLPLALANIDYRDEDIALKTGEEIIKLRNFGTEYHKIKTLDGYYLEAQRILNPYYDKQENGKRTKKSPVVFVHGVMLSMTTFLANSGSMTAKRYESSCALKNNEISNANEFSSLPLLLANNNYDVWMINIRGVGRSNHTDHNTTVNDDSFWNFNLDTLTHQELPAIIRYVREYTKSTTIGFVGHSQATFLALAALSEYSEMNDILKPVVLLAPCAYLDHMAGLCRQIAAAERLLIERNNFKDSRRPDDNFPIYMYDKCKREKKFCNLLSYAALGQSDMKNYPLSYSSHIGFPTAAQNLNHFYQLVHKYSFAHYDHGIKKNLLLYGQSKPPHYHVEKITNKYIVLVYGDTDLLTTPVDVKRLIAEFKVPILKVIRLSAPSNHMDMIVSDSAGLKVNKPLLELFESLAGC